MKIFIKTKQKRHKTAIFELIPSQTNTIPFLLTGHILQNITGTRAKLQ